jgi:two-component system OmpR family response regulator
MKILIIEDNPRLTDRIVHHLGKSFSFDSYETGEEGLSAAVNSQYNVILLDLGLPDMVGLDVCKELRAQSQQTPILVLTGQAEVESKVTLLRAGADDYMVKPFDINELRARILALSRRNHRLKAIRSKICFKDLTLDPETREVFRAGREIKLRRKEFDILECLLINEGQVMTREAIMSYAWNSSSNSWQSTVDVHIKHLRDKVDRPFGVYYIQTVYGIGYRVESPPKDKAGKSEAL